MKLKFNDHLTYLSTGGKNPSSKSGLSKKSNSNGNKKGIDINRAPKYKKVNKYLA